VSDTIWKAEIFGETFRVKSTGDKDKSGRFPVCFVYDVEWGGTLCRFSFSLWCEVGQKVMPCYAGFFDEFEEVEVSEDHAEAMLWDMPSSVFRRRKKTQ